MDFGAGHGAAASPSCRSGEEWQHGQASGYGRGTPLYLIIYEAVHWVRKGSVERFVAIGGSARMEYTLRILFDSWSFPNLSRWCRVVRHV